MELAPFLDQSVLNVFKVHYHSYRVYVNENFPVAMLNWADLAVRL